MADSIFNWKNRVINSLFVPKASDDFMDAINNGSYIQGFDPDGYLHGLGLSRSGLELGTALQKQSVVAEPLSPEQAKEIIEEIHRSFYTEVDRLLEAASVTESLETQKQSLIDKCERLKKSGFANTKEMKEAQSEIMRLNVSKAVNDSRAAMLSTIRYFQDKYPGYKFITEESVKKICQKYGLIYGSIDRYTGNVPDANLKAIEDFQINAEDRCYQRMETQIEYHGGLRGFNYRQVGIPISLAEFNKKEVPPETMTTFSQARDFGRGLLTAQISSMPTPSQKPEDIFKDCLMEIAAPSTDFNTEGMEAKDSKLVNMAIEVPDPVVLAPVFHNGQKHYLVVTAWGLEASDELVVNQKMN